MIWFPLNSEGFRGPFFRKGNGISSAPTLQAFEGKNSLGISGGYTSKLSKFSTKILGFFYHQGNHHSPTTIITIHPQFFSHMKNSHDTELTDRNLTARLLLADLCLTTGGPSMDRHSGDRDRGRRGGGLGGGRPGWWRWWSIILQSAGSQRLETTHLQSAKANAFQVMQIQFNHLRP